MIPELSIEAFEIYVTGLDHPECLAFDREGNLWAGGEAGQIYFIEGKSGFRQVANLGSFCAGLAFSPSDELFVCCPALGIARIKTDGKHEVFASHAGNHKIICSNFGVFDSEGNYYVTDSGQWKKRNGYLLRFTPDGKGEIIGGPFGYANGLALSADETQIFMVESDTDRIFRFLIDHEGKVGKPEIYAAEAGRFPDGLALDAAGNLYACCYASDQIHRIAPDGKKTLFAWDRNAILLGSPTNMAFGGGDFDEIYIANLARTTITRAKIGRRGQRLANQRQN